MVGPLVGRKALASFTQLGFEANGKASMGEFRGFTWAHLSGFLQLLLVAQSRVAPAQVQRNWGTGGLLEGRRGRGASCWNSDSQVHHNGGGVCTPCFLGNEGRGKGLVTLHLQFCCSTFCEANNGLPVLPESRSWFGVCAGGCGMRFLRVGPWPDFRGKGSF